MLLGICVALAVTVLMPAWLSFHGTDAGLWGIEGGTRWDDTRADLDIYIFGYLGFASGLVTIVLGSMVGAGLLRGRPGPVAAARRAAIITACAMVAFVVRLLLENGWQIAWASVVGVASIAALHVVLRRL